MVEKDGKEAREGSGNDLKGKSNVGREGIKLRRRLRE